MDSRVYDMNTYLFKVSVFTKQEVIAAAAAALMVSMRRQGMFESMDAPVYDMNTYIFKVSVFTKQDTSE